MYTNSLGFRDSSCELYPPNNHKRILLLGIRIPRGVGVAFENTFAGILDKKERKKALRSQCIGRNYSPQIHYLKARWLFRKKHLKVKEVWVIY
jgi:hypothetical protein